MIHLEAEACREPSVKGSRELNFGGAAALWIEAGTSGTFCFPFFLKLYSPGNGLRRFLQVPGQIRLAEVRGQEGAE